MAEYIFTERNGIYIIDLQKTVKKLDEAYMFVRDSGEVLRYGSMWDLLFVPALGFVLCGATIATGLKQAGKYVDEPNMAKITFARSVRNALVQNVVFIVATGIILYGAVSGHGIGF